MYVGAFGSSHPVAHPFGICLGMFAQDIKMRRGEDAPGPVMPMSSPSIRGVNENMMLQLANVMMGQLMNQATGATTRDLPLRVFGGAPGAPQVSPLALEGPAMPGEGQGSSQVSASQASASHADAGGEQKQLSVQDASERVRLVMKRQEGENAGDDEGESPAAKVLKRPAAPTSAAVLKRPAAAAPTSTSGLKAFITMEKTRSQVRCRQSDGTSFAIPWGYRNGEWLRSMNQATAEAKAWLATAYGVISSLEEARAPPPAWPPTAAHAPPGQEFLHAII